MLFRNLFIATLAALAFAGCSDDKDNIIDGPTTTEAGDVNVVFRAGSIEQVQTKADMNTSVYDNFVLTESVSEYCLKKKVTDPEFVIDHLTVFVFDNKDNLVKTAYFKDQPAATTDMKIPDDADAEANSIYEFGGIVLKQGTYKFILAGNLTKDQIVVTGDATFDNYKAATIKWTGENGISDDIASTYLPMIKVFEGIKLEAEKITATATLNLIGWDKEKATVVAPSGPKDESVLSVSSPILLTRLVSRIQLKSLKFDWTVTVKDDKGQTVGTRKPETSLILEKVYLANAANMSLLTDAYKGKDGGLVQGFEAVDNDLFTGTKADKLLIQSDYDTHIQNGVASSYVKWVNNNVPEDATAETKDKAFLPLSFYAFSKTIDGGDIGETEDLIMVLECIADYKNEGGNGVTKPVYYYVPIRDKDVSKIEANMVYNVNVTLKGQGSDVLGKLQEKDDASVELSVGPWAKTEDIIIEGTPEVVQ